MGDDPRFNGPPQGFRGRPPFPPRGPGMPSFRPPMEPPFGRPPFPGRGPRPLFPRGRANFGHPPDSGEEEFYEENPDLGEGETGAEDWNEGAEKGEEQWPEEGNEDEGAGGYGRRQGRWRGNGRRGDNEAEDEGHGRRPWRGNDRRNDEMESGGRWGGGNRREWEDNRGRGGGRWGGQNRPNHDDEEGGGRRRGGHWRQEDEGQSRDRHGQDNRRQWAESGDVAEEEPSPKRGRWGGDERKQTKSAWGEFFNDTTGEVIGLEDAKEPEQHVADRAEKKPRKTRWSSAEPIIQPPMEQSEVLAAELEEGAAESSQLSQESASLANENQPQAEELSSNTTAEVTVADD